MSCNILNQHIQRWDSLCDSTNGLKARKINALKNDNPVELGESPSSFSLGIWGCLEGPSAGLRNAGILKMIGEA